MVLHFFFFFAQVLLRSQVSIYIYMMKSSNAGMFSNFIWIFFSLGLVVMISVEHKVSVIFLLFLSRNIVIMFSRYLSSFEWIEDSIDAQWYLALNPYRLIKGPSEIYLNLYCLRKGLNEQLGVIFSSVEWIGDSIHVRCLWL